MANTNIITGSVTVVGVNPDLNTVDLPEDIWKGASVLGEHTYTFPSAQGFLTISSTSSDDTAGGIGARLLLLTGTDEAFNEIVEVIVPSGTTPVVTANEFFRVNDFRVIAVGSAKGAIGNITAVNGAANTLALIANGDNRALQTIYTVPTKFKTGVVVSGLSLSIGSIGNIIVNAAVLVGFGGVESFEVGATVGSEGTSLIANDVNSAPQVLPGFDFRLRVFGANFKNIAMTTNLFFRPVGVTRS